MLFRNPLIGLALPALLLALGAVGSALDSDRATRQATARDTAKAAVSARLEGDQADALATLAATRYSGPCTWIQSAQVAEGWAYAGANGQPLPDGATVCDSYGTTAVIRSGVASQVATITDQTVIRSFLGW